MTEHNVKLHHAGGSMKHFQSVPLEHAQWFYGIVGGLQPSQVEAAFRAAYSDVPTTSLANPQDEAMVKGFAAAFDKRMQELRAAAQGSK